MKQILGRADFRSRTTRNSAITDKTHYAFRGQSRSPNMVPFDMLAMVSYYCATVSLFLRRTILRYSTSNMPWPWKPG